MIAQMLQGLAQMIQQGFQQVLQGHQELAAKAGEGEKPKKLSPAERMDAIEAQLSQLTGQPPAAGGAPGGEAAPAAPTAEPQPAAK